MANYYDALGVSQSASEDEIKKAYRKLSLKYHPDRNSEPEAKHKFQEINQAYEVLGDGEAKKRYDRQLQFGGGGGGGDGGEEFVDMNDLNNILNMMFAGGMPGGGGGIFGRMNAMPHGFHHGGGGGFAQNIRIFHNGQQVFTHMMGKPDPIIKQITISLEQSYTGCNIPVEIERTCIDHNAGSQQIEKETIYVNLLPGIDDNEQLTIADKGNRVNDQCGDVKLVVKVVNNTRFIRNGLDLIYNKTLTLKESLCGFTFEMVHLNGKKLCINNINNSTVIKPNFVKVIQSMGMNRENSTGNMIIQFEVVFPETLTAEQIAGLSAIL